MVLVALAIGATARAQEAISLLDRECVVVAHVDGLDAATEPIVTRVKALLSEP